MSHKIKHYGLRFGRKDAPDVKGALEEALQKRDAEIKALIEKAQAEVEAKGKIAEETKSALEDLATRGKETQEKLHALEQELDTLKAAPAAKDTAETIGEMFAKSEDFQELVRRGRGTAILHLKAVADITSSNAGDAVDPMRLPGWITPPDRELTIRDLLMPGRTASSSIEYVEETGFTNSAAAVAEGAAKPQSDITLARKSTSVKTLAHWMKASKQILADVPQLQSYIDTRLRYGLKFFEETQILAGDGTGDNLLGLIPQATPFDDGLRVDGDTAIDTLRRAILQVRIAEYRASGIVLNPKDWADIELQKDKNGQYLWVNVTVGGAQQLWRLPVLDTNSMPEGDFLVGAFNRAAQIFDREDANVQVSTEDGDNFTHNMVTIRGEERLAMVVYRPESVVYGSFAAPPST